MKTKQATLAILKRRPKSGFYPHELREILFRECGIALSESSVTRNLRRYKEVLTKPPAKPGVKAHTYHLEQF